MKYLLLVLALFSSNAFAFYTGKSNPSAEELVLVYDRTEPRGKTLKFPCLLIGGEVSCDPNVVRIQDPVCARTLFVEEKGSVLEISCRLKLVDALIANAPAVKKFLPLDNSPLEFVPVRLGKNTKLNRVMRGTPSGLNLVTEIVVSQ